MADIHDYDEFENGHWLHGNEANISQSDLQFLQDKEALNKLEDLQNS